MYVRLLEQLRAQANLYIRNGYCSERSLARRVRVSQPQLHNVLKGARTLTPALADRILRAITHSVSMPEADLDPIYAQTLMRELAENRDGHLVQAANRALAKVMRLEREIAFLRQTWQPKPLG